MQNLLPKTAHQSTAIHVSRDLIVPLGACTHNCTLLVHALSACRPLQRGDSHTDLQERLRMMGR